MKLVCLFSLIVFMSLLGYSQELIIIDKETQEPLEFVSVYNENLSVFLTSNSKGKVNIQKFHGESRVNFSLLGYKQATVSYDSLKSLKFKLGLKKSSINLDQVVISASKWNQKKSNIPSRLVSIKKKELHLQNPQTAADMLQLSDQVFIQKSQLGGGSPMIRGFSTNRLLYSVDGVRMNTAIFRSGNLQNVISLDPYSIESTEVLFGPGSVIYGSDAIGGVMNFQSLQAQLSTNDSTLYSGSTSLRYSSANQEQTLHGHFGIGLKKWAILSSFTRTSYEDLQMGSVGPEEYKRLVFVDRIYNRDAIIINPDPNKQTPSAYSQINFLQKVKFQPNEKMGFEYGFHFSETSDYSRYDRHLMSRNGVPRYGEWYYGPQKWMMNYLKLDWTEKKTLLDRLNIRLAQQSFEESRNSRDYNSLEKEKRTENVEAYSLNLDVQKNYKNHQFFYGVESILNTVKSKGINKNIGTGVEVSGPARYPESVWLSNGLYINDLIQLSPKFSFELGTRYNFIYLESDFDTSFYPLPFQKTVLKNSSLTGNLGLIYKANNNFNLYSSFAKAFRSPNVDDIGKVFDSEPGSVVVPNPNLKPEEAYNSEVGFDVVFSNNFKVDAALYYTWLENALVRRNFTLGGNDSIIYDGVLSQVQAIQNAARSEVYGFQLGIKVKINSNFSLRSNFNYQKGTEELDNGETSPSRHAAPWFGAFRINYIKNKLSGEFYLIANGEVSYRDLNVGERNKPEIYAEDNFGRPYSPFWYTLNLKASYAVSSRFEVNLGIENILDIRYRTYSSGIAAPGRNIISSLRYHF